jgi:Rrf2 family protein
VHVSAKSDYALRAMIELAAVGTGGSMAAHAIAARQQIPVSFLLNILAELRRAGLVDSRPGRQGGWALRATPDAITVADVIRAVDGPLVGIEARRPNYPARQDVGAALSELWRAVGVGVTGILEHTTIASLLPQDWLIESAPTTAQRAC